MLAPTSGCRASACKMCVAACALASGTPVAASDPSPCGSGVSFPQGRVECGGITSMLAMTLATLIAVYCLTLLGARSITARRRKVGCTRSGPRERGVCVAMRASGDRRPLRRRRSSGGHGRDVGRGLRRWAIHGFTSSLAVLAAIGAGGLRRAEVDAEESHALSAFRQLQSFPHDTVVSIGGPSQSANSARVVQQYWPYDADVCGGCGAQKRRRRADEPLEDMVSDHNVQVHRLHAGAPGDRRGGRNRRWRRGVISVDVPAVAGLCCADRASEDASLRLTSNDGPSQRATSARAVQLYWPREADVRGSCGGQKRRRWADEPLVDMRTSHIMQVHHSGGGALAGRRQSWNRSCWRTPWPSIVIVHEGNGRTHCEDEADGDQLGLNCAVCNVLFHRRGRLATPRMVYQSVAALACGGASLSYWFGLLLRTCVGHPGPAEWGGGSGARQGSISYDGIILSARWIGGMRTPLAKRRVNQSPYHVLLGQAPRGKHDLFFILHVTTAERATYCSVTTTCCHRAQSPGIFSPPNRVASCGSFHHHHTRRKGHNRDDRDRVGGPTRDRGRSPERPGHGPPPSPARRPLPSPHRARRDIRRACPQEAASDHNVTQEGRIEETATGCPLYRHEEARYNGRGVSDNARETATHGDITIRCRWNCWHGGDGADGAEDDADVGDDGSSDRVDEQRRRPTCRLPVPPSPFPPRTQGDGGLGAHGGEDARRTGLDEGQVRRPGPSTSIATQAASSDDNSCLSHGGWNGGWDGNDGGRHRGQPRGPQNNNASGNNGFVSRRRLFPDPENNSPHDCFCFQGDSEGFDEGDGDDSRDRRHADHNVVLDGGTPPSDSSGESPDVRPKPQNDCSRRDADEDNYNPANGQFLRTSDVVKLSRGHETVFSQRTKEYPELRRHAHVARAQGDQHDEGHYCRCIIAYLYNILEGAADIFGGLCDQRDQADLGDRLLSRSRRMAVLLINGCQCPPRHRRASSADADRADEVHCGVRYVANSAQHASTHGMSAKGESRYGTDQVGCIPGQRATGAEGRTRLGPRDKGAGVRDWLMSEEDSIQEPHVDALDCRPIRVFGIHRLLELRGGGPLDDVAEDIADEGQNEVEGRPTPISIWEAIGGDGYEPSHRPRPAHPLIRGHRGEVAVMMCNGCFRDQEVGTNEWLWCTCGAVQCAACAARPCPRCHQCEVRRTFRAPWLVEVAQGAEAERVDLEPPQMRDLPAFPVHDTGQPLAGTGSRIGPQVPGDDRACTTCGRDLRQEGSTWRICRCGANICDPCANGCCTCCGAAPMRGGAREGMRDELPGPQFFSMRDESEVCDEDGWSVTTPGAATMCDEGCTLPPDALLARRDKLINDRRDERIAKRKRSHRVREQQRAEGLRPKRATQVPDRVSFVTANASAASTLIREVRHGTQLRRASYLFIQEHGLEGEALDRHMRDLADLGWEGVATRAYRKVTGLGGGTAVLTSSPNGLRPVCRAVEQQVGRITLAIANFGFDILLVSLYGVSGGGLARQTGLWRYAVEWIRLLGLPFVIGGDLQVTPKEIQTSRLCDLIQGKVIAPSGTTTTLADRVIDMFIVSKGLQMDTQQVQRCVSCIFRPHYPVIMTLRLACRGKTVRRIVRPRALPIERPTGPQLPGARVDWADWRRRNWEGGQDQPRADDLERLMTEWYAGAEAELTSTFGLYDTPEEVSHLGMGAAVRIVEGQAKGRFRDSDDKLGLVGHRLSTAARSLSVFCSAARKLTCYGNAVRAAAGLPNTWFGAEHVGRNIFRGLERRGITADGNPLPQAPHELDDLRRMGHYAAALIKRREFDLELERGEDRQAYEVLSEALRFIAHLAREHGDSLPLLDLMCLGSVDVDRMIAIAAELRDRTDEQMKMLAIRRKKVEMEGTKRWAQRVPLAVAHRVTRPTDYCGAHSASANKKHLGEETPQGAADHGADEWGPGWGDNGVDVADEVLRTVEALEVVERDYDDMTLPTIDDEITYHCAMRFKASTEVGTDWMRPRHVALLSRSARGCLGSILELIEQVMRWPSNVRYIVAVALAKKAGGSRLIGVATTVYRLWAKIRYVQCRAILEARIARPYLAAAPRRGAGRAAFELAFQAELTAANDEVTATTLVDMAQFFEHIRTDEYYKGGRRIGIPRCILSLTAHMYMGPRRIRVRGAYSRALYPAWSVLPGCTWATVHVRLILIKPVDGFVRQLNNMSRTWGTRANISFYIDDGTATTSGPLNSVAFAHARITDAFMAFVKGVLRKKLAQGKIQCVATTPQLRTRLQEQLRDSSIKVAAHGDMLGVDYSAGGQMTRKPIQAKRAAKVKKRASKIAWWRKLCGKHAKQVVKGGLTPSVTHGGHVHGIPSSVIKKLRAAQASVCKVRCGGSSVTARLAIGGEKHQDIDPAVVIGVPPFMSLISALWDDPKCRQPYTKGWLRAREELAGAHPTVASRRIRGPIGAARHHLAAIGVEWPAPFRIKALGHQINILETPPLQIR